MATRTIRKPVRQQLPTQTTQNDLDTQVREISADIERLSSSAQDDLKKLKKLVREWKRRQQRPRITFSNWEPKGQTPLWMDPSPATSRPTAMCGRRPE